MEQAAAHLSRLRSQSGLLQALMRDLDSDMSCAYIVAAGIRGAQASDRNTKRWLSGSCRAERSSSRCACTHEDHP